MSRRSSWRGSSSGRSPVLYGAFLALKPARLGEIAGGTILINGQPLKLPVEPVLKLIALAVSVAIAFVTGLGMMAQWPTLALYWYAPDGAALARDPIFNRPLTFYLFTLPAWEIITGWLMTMAVFTCIIAVFFIVITGGTRVLSRVVAGTRQRHADRPVAGPVDYLRGPVADAGRARVPRTLRAPVRGPHDLRRRHLHRRARHADRHARRLLRARRGGADGRRQRGVRAAPALVDRVGRPRPRLLRRGERDRLVRQQLHRQAERAGARAALHRAQHRDDAAGVRARPHRAESVPRRRRRRGARPRAQSGDAAEHPAVGLARAAGHAAPDSGNPHLLRLSRHRHRPLQGRRIGAPDDARRARAQRREAAGEQPQLDQRKADLHARLRRDDEPGERLHAGRPADARPEQHADSEHDSRHQGDAAGDLFRRAHEHRRLREDAPEGVQLPAGRDQQPHLLRGQRRHRVSAASSAGC